MSRLDSIPASLTSVPAASLGRGSARRLIVLFPAFAIEDPSVSQRIWQIASSGGLDVLFLSLCNDYSEEAQLRRKLVTMAAVIKDGIVSTDIMIESGNDWLGRVKNILQPGDILACYGGQKVGLMRRSLDQALRSSFDVPLHLLSENSVTKKRQSSFIPQFLAWIGSLGIIAGFFWAEIRIVQLQQDWAHTSLLYFCLLLEVALIWGWNSIFM